MDAECILYLGFRCENLKCAEELIKIFQSLYSDFDFVDNEEDIIFKAYVFSNRDNKFIEQCDVTKVSINA